MLSKYFTNLNLVHALIFILFAGTVSVYASIFGFLSPDSIVYLDMASSFNCSVRSEFFTGFPCGYPLLISLIDVLTFSINIVTISKILNLLLLLASYLLIASITNNLILKTILFLNPISLYLSSWTWSENLFFLSFYGTIYSLVNISNQKKPNSIYFLSLLFFLILGCSSRYFFGPFCVVIFISIGLSFSWKMAFRCLPYFIIACLFFVSYQFINLNYPEYTSWNLNNYATESFSYLLYKFTENTLQNLFLLLISASVFIYFSYSKTKDNHQILTNPSDKKIIEMLFYSGLGYLTLIFFLRTYFSFDIYDTRLTGLGCILIFSSLLLKILDKNKIRIRFSLKSLVFIGIISFVLHQKHWDVIKPVLDGNYQKPIGYYKLKSGTQHPKKSNDND